MSGAHTHSAEDMRSLSHLMAIVHVPQLEKKSGSTGPCCRHLQKHLFPKRSMKTKVFTWLTSICSMYKMYIVLGNGQSHRHANK